MQRWVQMCFSLPFCTGISSRSKTFSLKFTQNHKYNPSWKKISIYRFHWHLQINDALLFSFCWLSWPKWPLHNLLLIKEVLQQWELKNKINTFMTPFLRGRKDMQDKVKNSYEGTKIKKQGFCLCGQFSHMSTEFNAQDLPWTSCLCTSDSTGFEEMLFLK